MRRLTFTFGFLAATVGSVANAAEPKAGDVIENSLKMKLAYIPPGEFDMGSPEGEEERGEEEKLHHVKFTKGYYLGAHEVTQSQFEKVLGRNPSHFRNDGAGKDEVLGQDKSSFPVERVTWFDAVEFCNALSKSEKLSEYYTIREVKRKDGRIESAKVSENGGNGYRLPTEAEWEYACRAGTKTPFHFGEVLNGTEANVDGNYPYGTTTKGTCLDRTCTVGNYPANPFGLYDMHGNVWEWCNDWYGDYAGDGVDPRGPESGIRRVLRGGSFGYFLARYSRSAYRNCIKPSYRNYDSGFRVARTYPLAP